MSSSSLAPPVLSPAVGSAGDPPNAVVRLAVQLLAAIKPGWQTSEAHLTAAVAVFGGVVEVLALFTDALKSAGVDTAWLRLAAVVVGGAMAVLPVLGYNRGRAIQKQTAVAVAQVAQAMGTAAATKVSVSVPQGAAATHP